MAQRGDKPLLVAQVDLPRYRNCRGVRVSEGAASAGLTGTKVARPRAIAAADINPLTLLRRVIMNLSCRPSDDRQPEFLWRTVWRAVLSDLALVIGCQPWPSNPGYLARACVHCTGCGPPDGRPPAPSAV